VLAEVTGCSLCRVSSIPPGFALGKPSRRDGGIFGMIDSLKQDDEFVAALAAYGVRGANTIPQTIRHALQELVTDRMSQGIVDVLEAIHIQEEQRNLVLVSLREGNCLADTSMRRHSTTTSRTQNLRFRNWQRIRILKSFVSLLASPIRFFAWIDLDPMGSD
jgi:hypothetical protein